MLRSKLLRKTILIVCGLNIVFILGIYAFTMPKIEKSLNMLSQARSKAVLSKIVSLTENVSKDLESFKKNAVAAHKTRLKDLTGVAWSVIDNRYDQSKLENIGIVLQERGDQFKRNLETFYNTNRGRFSREQLKQKIANYIRIHRYDNDNGYFFVNDFDSRSVIHPLKPELEGKSFKAVKDRDGVYYVNKMVDICKGPGAGVLRYKWENPKTDQVEDKVAYVFRFAPFDWIVGTGEYYSELNNRLKQDVVDIARDLRYGRTGYFFIVDYNSRVLSHPFEADGTDFSQVRDLKGNLVVSPMVEIARKQGEGFYAYWWKKDPADTGFYKKLSYARDFPDWQMVIGTGVYIDDIEKEVSKRKSELIDQLRQLMRETKIGETGYFFIFNGQGKMLIHPNVNLEAPVRQS